MNAREAYEAQKMIAEKIQAELTAFDTSDEEKEIARLNAIIRKKQAVAASRRAELRAQEKVVDSAKRIWDVELENEKIAAQRAEASVLFSEVRAVAKWRDRAMKHQIEGAEFMAVAKRAICADSMGLGKTLEGVMFLDNINAKRVLVVCPGEVMSGWRNELAAWSDRRPVIIGRKPKAKQMTILRVWAKLPDTGVTIVNYEAWARNNALIDALVDMNFDTVIIDEAHTIKETDTRAFKGVSQVVLAKNTCPVCRKPLKMSERQICDCGFDSWYAAGTNSEDRRSVSNVIAMTGTPILNRPEEIWPLLYLLYPKLFPAKNSFLRDYCTFNTYTSKYELSSGGMSTLKRKLEGFYIRRDLKAAGITLPPQDITVHKIELDRERFPKQAAIMDMLQKDAAVRVADKSVKLIELLALITRQRQAAVWPGGIYMNIAKVDAFGDWVYDEEGKQLFDRVHVGKDYQESCKMDYAEGLFLEFTMDGQRSVGFSQFKEVLIEAEKRLTALGLRVVRYDGDTPEKQRIEIKNNFDRSLGEEPKWDIVLCHYKTGGQGLNLTAATQIVIFDEEWNPGKNKQAYDRINRMGQTENTGVHVLRLENNIDTWLANLIASKQEIVDTFNSSFDEKLAVQDIYDIFKTDKYLDKDE